MRAEVSDDQREGGNSRLRMVDSALRRRKQSGSCIRSVLIVSNAILVPNTVYLCRHGTFATLFPEEFALLELFGFSRVMLRLVVVDVGTSRYDLIRKSFGTGPNPYRMLM